MSKIPERLPESPEPPSSLVEIGGVMIPSGTEVTIDIEHIKGEPRTVETGYQIVVQMENDERYVLVAKTLDAHSADLRTVSKANIIRNNLGLFRQPE